MSERVTVIEYARHRRVTRQAVYKALAAGRITRDCDGRIDLAAADRQWQESTDPLRGGPPAGSTDTADALQAVLGDQPARLARAADVVPALAPWLDFINWSAASAARVGPDPDSDPLDAIRSNPLELTSLLYDMIANYLIDTGAADADRIDEADLVMFPIHPPKE